jgi:hypothetical protein
VDESRDAMNVAEGVFWIVTARRGIVGQSRGVSNGEARALSKTREDLTPHRAPHEASFVEPILRSGASNQPGDLRHWVHGDIENPS